MSNAGNDNEVQEKPSGRGAYPYYSLEKSLEAAKVVLELGGNRQEVQRSLIAQRLKLGDSASALGQLLGAAKCFGLIDGRGAFKLTPLAMDYLCPTDESQKQRELLNILIQPTAFDKLIMRFDGNKAPSQEILSNLLQREMSVPKSWSGRIASLFMSAVRDVGALDSEGFIRHEASLHGTMVQTSQPVVPHPTSDRQDGMRESVPGTQQVPKPVPSDLDRNVWFFTLKGGSVRVETSKELSMDLWNKLDQYIQVLKPEQDDGGPSD
ncbi:MAG: hypothetical protein MUP47_05395 [Phycisphaerae bacterium]|nr:hypothetical protein [Phycisphaerae bacterium]